MFVATFTGACTFLLWTEEVVVDGMVGDEFGKD